MIDLNCVIFAGGKSSRMQTNKALLPFGKYSTLTEFQYNRLSKIFKKVYISTKNSSQFNFKADFIEEKSNIFAPTVGFVESFKRLDTFFVISVDSPFISKNIITKLVDEYDSSYDAIIAKSPFGTEPLCGIYNLSLKEKFNTMLKNDEHKLGVLLKSSNIKYVEFKDKFSFTNLNYPDEYKEAKKYEFNTPR